MVNRQSHILKPVDVTERPTHVVFTDTETTQHEIEPGTLKHTFRLGYASYHRTRRGETLRYQKGVEYYDIQAFWYFMDSVLQKGRRVYLVTHNLNYDLPVLDSFKRLYERGFSLEQFYSKSQVNVFRWKRYNDRHTGELIPTTEAKDYEGSKIATHVVALDNGNLFRGKLEEWGDIVGYPKLSVDFDNVSDPDLMTYCKRDVKIMVELWLIWFKFLDTHDIGRFKFTVASTAFEAYRHRFMPSPIYVHTDDNALKLSRSGYHGGRVEVFKQGYYEDSNYYYLDFNSMYPYVMREYDYPAWLWGYQVNPSVSFVDNCLSKSSVMVDVSLKVDEPVYPVKVKLDSDNHPLKIIHPLDPEYHKLGSRIVYPVGEFRTVLTTPELTYALAHGWVKGYHAVSWYKPVRLFREYVDYFYGERKRYEREGLGNFAALTKLMLNSLYGKFGQLGIDQRKIGDCDPDIIRYETVIDIDNHDLYNLTFLGGSVIRTNQEGESYHSLPSIAAHVTAYARLHLWEHIKRIPEGHIYYCDTDSLLTDEIGYRSLSAILDPDRLGALKVEHKSEWVEIRAPKDYSMVGRDRIKGISYNAEYLGNGRYRQTQWRRIRGMIHAGNVSEYHTSQVIKVLRREIKSGFPQENGSVAPFEFPQDLRRPQPEG